MERDSVKHGFIERRKANVTVTHTQYLGNTLFQLRDYRLRAMLASRYVQVGEELLPGNGKEYMWNINDTSIIV